MRKLLLQIIIYFWPVLAGAYQVNDAHMHYNYDVHDSLSPEEAVKLIEEADIKCAAISSTPSSATDQIYKLKPDSIIPLVRPYRVYRDKYTWHSNPESVEYVKKELTKGIYKGLGEFHLFKENANNDVVRQLMQLAAEHQLIPNAHADIETIRALLKMQPGKKLVWAHCGMDHPVKEVFELIEDNPNLYCDLSFRNDITYEDLTIRPVWKQFLEQYPGRFMIGLDSHIPRRWAKLTELAMEEKTWLNQLSGETRKKIAYTNFETLYGCR